MILIKSGIVIDPESETESICDILIIGGTVAEIGEIAPKDGMQVIDAKGLHVSPGLIDVHVHFRDPGYTHKEDIASGAKAAAKGGFTTVICMANTSPAVDNSETLQYVLDKATKADINVFAVAAVTKDLQEDCLTDMRELIRLGAVGFSNDGIAIRDENILRKALEESKCIGAPVCLHEEDPSMISQAGCDDGAPAISEYSMIERDCDIAASTGACIHIQHLSSAKSVDVIARAKARGVKVTAEVTPNHLALTKDAVKTYGTLAKVNPPLRSEADRQALIDGLKDGVIDIIASDHAPHSEEEKARPFTEAPSGIIGLETSLGIVTTYLVREGLLTLPQIIKKMTVNPAKLFGLDSGRIAIGKRADITIFSANESFTVKDFESKSSNSPFIGKKLYGKVKYTICGGKIVYQDQNGESMSNG